MPEPNPNPTPPAELHNNEGNQVTPPPATPAPAPNPSPTEIADQAKQQNKDWLMLAGYPAHLLEEDPPKPPVQPLDLEKDKNQKPPETPAVAPTAPPAATPPAPEPTPEAVKVTKRKAAPEIDEIVKQAVAATVKATAPPATPTPPAPKPAEASPAPPEEDLTNWTADEIRFLRAAHYAEQSHPEKYKGLVSGIKADKQKIEDYRTKAIAEDPDWNESRDEKFENLFESLKPRLNGRELAELEEERIVTEAEKRVIAKQEAKFQAQESQLAELRAKPVVEQTVGYFAKGLTSLLVQKGEKKPESLAAIASDYAELGEAETLKKHKMTGPIVVDTVKRAIGLAHEFTRLDMGLDKPNSNNKRHQWLNQFMANYDHVMSQQPAEKKVRIVEGMPRTFISRAEYAKLATEDPQRLSQYWTADTNDYLSALGAHAEWEASQRISQFEADLTADGYHREAPKPSDPPKPASQPSPPVEMKPTVPVPSPAPGPGTGGTVKSGEALIDEETMKLLGYR